MYEVNLKALHYVRALEIYHRGLDVSGLYHMSATDYTNPFWPLGPLALRCSSPWTKMRNIRYQVSINASKMSLATSLSCTPMKLSRNMSPRWLVKIRWKFRSRRASPELSIWGTSFPSWDSWLQILWQAASRLKRLEYWLRCGVVSVNTKRCLMLLGRCQLFWKRMPLSCLKKRKLDWWRGADRGSACLFREREEKKV